MGKRRVVAQDAPAGDGRRHGDAALWRENDHELEQIEGPRCGSRGSGAWPDWRPCHEFGTTGIGAVEQFCFQERTRRLVVRPGDSPRLRDQRSNRSVFQLARDVPSWRNDQREHQQPGLCDRPAERRTRQLGLRRPPHVQPANDQPDQFHTAQNLPGTPGFNPTLAVTPGFFAGWVTVAHTLELDDADHGTSSGTNAFYKADGTLYGPAARRRSLCGSNSHEREESPGR